VNAQVAVTVEILIGDRRVSLWRLRILGFTAYLLGIPLDTRAARVTNRVHLHTPNSDDAQSGH
jgi:hypothetical protein